MHKLTKSLLVAALLSLVIVGQVLWAGERVEQVTGSGLTRDEAVANGLEEAIRRARGVTVKSDRLVESSAAESSMRVDGEDHDRVSYAATQSGSTRMKTEGLVSSYEVISEQRDMDGGFLLEMRVHLNSYDTPGFSPHGRRKLAVLPLRARDSDFSVAGELVAGQRLSERVTHQLVNYLTQTRRFSVMDRMYTAEYVRENNFISGPDVPLIEYIKVGQALGVDYLVVGQVVDAGGEHNRKRLISSEVIERGSAHIRVDYRVIVMATRQVKWAATVDVDQEVRVDELDELLERMSESAAARISREMLDNIYPTTIAAIGPNGEIVLNQGGNGFDVGERLIVYRQGQVVRDPYTGESLGRTEAEVGRVEIVRLHAKVAYARMFSGGNAAIGDLCRSESAVTQLRVEGIPERADARKTADGGVLLPFDRP